MGISCASTGLSEAISLLEPLTSDVVDFVRQGALIAMAMVMVQTSTYPTGHGPNLIMAGLKHLYDLVLVFYLFVEKLLDKKMEDLKYLNLLPILV